MEVFSRFEAEAGGPLMKATLCLLEVSRHGLLETELLALLGNKQNTECPAYKVLFGFLQSLIKYLYLSSLK